MRSPGTRRSVVRTWALPACAVCLAASIGAVSVTSQASEVVLADGQSAAGYLSTPGRSRTPQAREDFGDLRAQTIDVSYVGEIRTRLAASVWFRGRQRTASWLRPLWSAPTRIITLSDTTYAPRLVVRAPSGRTVSDQISPLELRGPEDEDFVDVPAAKIRVVFTVFPDHQVVDGKDASKSMNPKNPRLRLTVFERVNGVSQQRILARKTLAVGESVSLPDGTAVVVRDLGRAGRFRALRSPAIPLVPAFVLLTFLSLADLLIRARVHQ